jgi:hypothetical protein
MQLFNGSICGNGIREGQEECDCGNEVQCANDPCCLPTCKLKQGAVCSDKNSPCCESCQVVSKIKNTVCRPSSGFCDLEETCDGSSAECPKDVKKVDGTPCNVTDGYCASGLCTNRDLQCQIMGKRLNSDGACTGNELNLQTSCQMTCKGPGGCYPFNSYFVDGTECASGRCYNGSCQQSNNMSVNLFSWGIIMDKREYVGVFCSRRSVTVDCNWMLCSKLVSRRKG